MFSSEYLIRDPARGAPLDDERDVELCRVSPLPDDPLDLDVLRHGAPRAFRFPVAGGPGFAAPPGGARLPA